MRRILWGRATSSNVMKAIWTLEELQLPYERIDVGGSFGKTDTADYNLFSSYYFFFFFFFYFARSARPIPRTTAR